MIFEGVKQTFRINLIVIAGSVKQKPDREVTIKFNFNLIYWNTDTKYLHLLLKIKMIC